MNIVSTDTSQIHIIRQTIALHRLRAFFYIIFYCFILYGYISSHQNWQIDNSIPDTQIQYKVYPVILPWQTTVYSWSVENIRGVYFDEIGVIGEDTKEKPGTLCQLRTLDVILQDESTRTYEFNTIVYVFDVTIISLLGIIVFQALYMINPNHRLFRMFGTSNILVRIADEIILPATVIGIICYMIIPSIEFIYTHMMCWNYGV